jgi:hypothetical protein
LFQTKQLLETKDKQLAEFTEILEKSEKEKKRYKELAEGRQVK